MENKEYKTNLIAGLPIEIIDLCKVYPLTLREIGEIGVNEYNSRLSLLLTDPKTIKTEIQLSRFDAYDILLSTSIKNQEFRHKIEQSLSMFLKDRVVFSIDHKRPFFVANKKYITNEHFKQIVDILKIQNLKQLTTDKPQTVKNMSKKHQQLLKKRKRGRKLMDVASGKSEVTLGDIISNLGIYTQSINNILDWTIYQLYDQYSKFMQAENYRNNFLMYIGGADPKALNLKKHWTLK